MMHANTRSNGPFSRTIRHEAPISSTDPRSERPRGLASARRTGSWVLAKVSQKNGKLTIPTNPAAIT